MPEFFQYWSQTSSKTGAITDPQWGPGGFWGRPGALGRDHVGSGSIFHRFRAPFWEPFGAMLGSKTVKKSIWGDSKSPKRLNTLLDGFQHRLLIDFGPILDLFLEGFLIRFAGYRNVHFDTATTCEILHFSSQSPPVYDFCLTDEV